MRDMNLLDSLFKALDKVVLGIESPGEPENQQDFIELDDEEEFDVKRSIN